jgi:hypothetical protein
MLEMPVFSGISALCLEGPPVSTKNPPLRPVLVGFLLAAVSGCNPLANPQAEYLRESQVLEALRAEHAAIMAEADSLEFEIKRGQRLADELASLGSKAEADRSRQELAKSDAILRSQWDKASGVSQQIRTQQQRVDAAKRKLGL